MYNESSTTNSSPIFNKGDKKPLVFNIIERSIDHFNSILAHPSLLIDESQMHKDSVATLIDKQPLLFDADEKLIIPSTFPSSCISKNFSYYSKNAHDNKFQRRFLRASIFPLRFISDTCVSSLIRLLHKADKHYSSLLSI